MLIILELLSLDFYHLNVAEKNSLSYYPKEIKQFTFNSNKLAQPECDAYPSGRGQHLERETKTL